MDLAGRAGKKMSYIAAMTVLLSLAAYLPWVMTIDKPAKNTSRAAALSISGVLYSVIMLAFAGIMGTDSLSTNLQGGVITLMYVMISTSLGYQSVRAKKDPVARAQTIYMTGLLVLITMFDLLGAARTSDKAATNAGEQVVINEVMPNLGNIYNETPANLRTVDKNLAGLMRDAEKAQERVIVAATAAAEQNAKNNNPRTTEQAAAKKDRNDALSSLREIKKRANSALAAAQAA
jgi:hypothetical protein